MGTRGQDIVKVGGIECPRCGARVWSRHRHDMRYCPCGYCYVDGGRDYMHVGFGLEEIPQEEWKSPEIIELEVDVMELQETKERWPY